ncbi:MAG: ATP-binding protein [Nanoarchaeota archaeon]
MQDNSFDEKLRKSDSFTDIKGQVQAKEQLRSALLMHRNVLIIGPPGVGKTTLAKNVARLLPTLKMNDCAYHCLPEKPLCPECRMGKTNETKTVAGLERFVRIQGSPELSAEDMLGDIDPIKALEFGPFAPEAFTPGKIFKANHGVLFFDELNRAPERLQNSLLQVLEERVVTLGNYDIDFEANFIFIATMNPQDSSTEKLSDVLLDRFDVIYMDYPETLEIEKEIVIEKGKKTTQFPDNLFEKTLIFIRGLRGHSQLEKYPSVRASLGVYERAQSLSQIRNHKTVELSDVKDSMLSVLVHRISLRASIKYLKDPSEVLKEEFEKAFSPKSTESESGDAG